MTSLPERAALREEILSAIQSPDDPLRDPARFDQLAIEVFRFQFAKNAIYRRYCELRGVTPAEVGSWLEIPAVPTDAFKAATLFCGNPTEATGFFETSGTTQGSTTRGRHFHRETDLYDAAMLRFFQPHLLPEGDPLTILSLVPPVSEVPRSSLSHMVEVVIRSWGAEGSLQALRRGELDLPGIIETVERADSLRRPLLILGTSFAFVHLHDQLAKADQRLQCPDGTRVMDTGGFKGKSREVPRAQLYTMIEQSLGVSIPWIINEYGMTEMSSQFYDGVAGAANPLEERRQRGPGWVRSVAVDPETLQPRPDGEPGILRHLDLANLDSVAALQTSDFGRVTPDGLELRGRAEGAEARGCSIAVDDLLAAAGRSRGEFN